MSTTVSKILTYYLIQLYLLTHFIATDLFDTPWKHLESLPWKQKARGFLMFSGGIKRDQWHEMG